MLSPTLAQFLTDSPVPPLPDPPFFARYFLESPGTIIAGLVLAGLITFILLNRQGRLSLGIRIAVFAFSLAGIVFALSAFVETPREKIAALTRDLVSVTAAANTTRLDPMLSDRIGFTCALPIPGIPTDKQSILDGVRHYLGEQYPIAEHSLGPVQATMDTANTARTQVRVWVKVNKEQAFYNAPIGSWWRIDWRKDNADTWHVANLTLVQLDGLGGNR